LHSSSGSLAMLAAMRRACRVSLWLACATPFHRLRACYIFSAVRDHILSEIRRLAGANGGHPPGRRSFAKITGIRESAWFGHYWPRWGDALIEAGFAPNTPPERLDEGHVFSKLAAACRHFGRFPVTKEMRMYKKVDADFPNEKSVISGFGNVAALKHGFAEWGRNNPGYEDVAAMVPESSSQPSTAAVSIEGFVYLIRSGAHYKIGRSDELERRVKEIRVSLPEAVTLVHAIRTDDPVGIEAYWHKRFASQRANGEWFKLSSSEVAAFKRRKYQ
jgi:Meiotically up-regulated gene 113